MFMNMKFNFRFPELISAFFASIIASHFRAWWEITNPTKELTTFSKKGMSLKIITAGLSSCNSISIAGFEIVNYEYSVSKHNGENLAE